MENSINGIHHITAIASHAASNYDFYTKVLGLRLVKKTVNFDDPKTYHLYYGDKSGTPGTVLTFFPWENIAPGRSGSRQVSTIAYSVPEKSLKFWTRRFECNRVNFRAIGEKFGEQYLAFTDPDGLKLELIVPKMADTRLPWETDQVQAANATRGFHSITITTNKMQPTADILTGVLGYRFMEKEANVYRFITDAVENAAIVDLIEFPGHIAGHVAGGSVHHVAFRVKNEEILMEYREKIASMGIHITEKIDRNYFYSLYFHEPGGVLFELATDNPGFAVDESVEELGSNLKLPEKYEQHRSTIEAILPQLY
jgi:glyoxalase family protein